MENGGNASIEIGTGRDSSANEAGFSDHPLTTRWIYFIQAGEAGPVKIGVATNVHVRIATLQTGHHEELRLLVAIPEQGSNHEAGLHHMFAAHRIRGEWFHPHDDVLAIPRTYAEAARVKREYLAAQQEKAA